MLVNGLGPPAPNPTQYGLYCFDEWEADAGKPAQYDEETGAVIAPAEPAREAGSRYGIRPDELAYFMLAVVDRRLAALEG